MEPQWKISAEGVGKEAKFEFPGKEGIEAQWFLDDQRIEENDIFSFGSTDGMNWVKMTSVSEADVGKKIALVLGDDRQEVTIEFKDKPAEEPQEAQEPVPESEKSAEPEKVPEAEKTPEPASMEEKPKEKAPEPAKPAPTPPTDKPLETVKEDEALETKPKWVPPPGVDVSRPYKDPKTAKLIDPATGEEIDIDLTDKKAEKAALKIQGLFRGHLTRKLGKMKILAMMGVGVQKIRKNLMTLEIVKPQPTVTVKPAGVKTKWFRDPNHGYWVQPGQQGIRD
ncbi:Oidioi.mRNA.OKI2018_I69.chr2.g7811.t1.cds [Oikopleura dioica]|uniref:Oidioi.mRNA.OKI2018_I69.chr2.g7811.t1.cds n=1 Tax=Oikopleura dioica TaxID=34765 RepID=A0ABN7T7D9_OIKDI|nr:Oidioi.mRNA.OKI2018_I69.chr2.g7811.t1.cds [Oikopleura dioica]